MCNSKPWTPKQRKNSGYSLVNRYTRTEPLAGCTLTARFHMTSLLCTKWSSIWMKTIPFALILVWTMGENTSRNFVFPTAAYQIYFLFMWRCLQRKTKSRSKVMKSKLLLNRKHEKSLFSTWTFASVFYVRTLCVFILKAIFLLKMYSDVSRYVTYCQMSNQRSIDCWNNVCYCSVAGKFGYQKKYDFNVCKQETSPWHTCNASEWRIKALPTRLPQRNLKTKVSLWKGIIWRQA